MLPEAEARNSLDGPYSYIPEMTSGMLRKYGIADSAGLLALPPKKLNNKFNCLTKLLEPYPGYLPPHTRQRHSTACRAELKSNPIVGGCGSTFLDRSGFGDSRAPPSSPRSTYSALEMSMPPMRDKWNTNGDEDAEGSEDGPGVFRRLKYAWTMGGIAPLGFVAELQRIRLEEPGRRAGGAGLCAEARRRTSRTSGTLPYPDPHTRPQSLLGSRCGESRPHDKDVSGGRATCAVASQLASARVVDSGVGKDLHEAPSFPASYRESSMTTRGRRASGQDRRGAQRVGHGRVGYTHEDSHRRAEQAVTPQKPRRRTPVGRRATCRDVGEANLEEETIDCSSGSHNGHRGVVLALQSI
ncbi:hypothetical protein K438DRAFT_1767613 [Mycena galopus ATCC 62051]|nr:hypothetical protein K438DRAFT_1767613 [Mycena galopus ATCC 62051]